MQLSKKSFAVTVLALFWGVILVSMATGAWQAKVTQDQVSVETVDDIKGWMKMGDVAKYLDLDLNQISQVINVGDIDPNMTIKELAEKNDKTPDDYKELLEKYMESKGFGPTPATAGNKANEKTEAAPEARTDGEADSNNAVTGEEIKGYMTFKYISDKYDIPVSEIYKKLNIPASQDPKTPMKDITAKYNFEVQDIRDLVAQYKK